MWFWEAVHGFTEAQKKRLLAFVTGSDRVPIRGLASLQPPFVISRNGPASDRLPTAHTCFNHLLLPAYAVRCPLSIPAYDPCKLGAAAMHALQGPGLAIARIHHWPRRSSCLPFTPAGSTCCSPPVLQYIQPGHSFWKIRMS